LDKYEWAIVKVTSPLKHEKPISPFALHMSGGVAGQPNGGTPGNRDMREPGEIDRVSMQRLH